ncbi:MAG: alpha/beta hydrolase [Rubricoccaceae bacterium]
MQHTSATISSTDGLKLFTRHWAPDRPTVAHLFLVHGVHEHSGRYAYVASHLMQHGIEIHALDLRGHGQSEGLRATVGSFAEYSDDVALALMPVLEIAGDVPVFLMGHSMGGLVVSRMVVDHGADGLAGIVLSSPALAVDAPAPLRALAPVLARWLPKLPVGSVDLSVLSHDPRVERAYRDDPLCTKRGLRAALGYEIIQSIEHVRQRVDAFAMPLYAFHGTADALTMPEGSKWIVEHAPSADKTLKLYEGFYHETLNELGRDTVLAHLTAWVLDRSR